MNGTDFGDTLRALQQHRLALQRQVARWGRSEPHGLPVAACKEVDAAVEALEAAEQAMATVQQEVERHLHEHTGALMRANDALRAELSERHGMAAALQEREARLRLALAAAHVGTWEWNLATGVVTWSAETEALFGLAPGTYEGTYEAFLARVHPADRSAIAAIASRAQQHGTDYEVEFRVLWPDGTLHWLGAKGQISCDPTGQPLWVRGVTSSTTARKQAEAALRASQQQYEILVNSIEGIVWEFDPRLSQFLFINQEAERLLGYPVERWLTEPGFWAEHLHPEDRDWVLASCLSAMQEQRNHVIEYRLIAADGRVVWLRDIVTAVVEHEQTALLRGVMIDISEDKHARVELLRAKEAAEAVVVSK
jgi:PAS domain S-box-containing protein